MPARLKIVRSESSAQHIPPSAGRRRMRHARPRQIPPSASPDRAPYRGGTQSRGSPQDRLGSRPRRSQYETDNSRGGRWKDYAKIDADFFLIISTMVSATALSLTIWPNSALARGCDVGVNVDGFQNLDATQQETIVQQLATSGVRCVRTSLRPDDKNIRL